MLLYDLRFVFAVPIARHRQLHIALAARNSFLVAAVSAVVRLFIPVVVLAVPEVAFKLRVHAFLNQIGGQFLHQRLYAGYVFDPSLVDQLSHEALFFLCHIGKPPLSLFYLTIEVYTIFDTLSRSGIVI